MTNFFLIFGYAKLYFKYNVLRVSIKFNWDTGVKGLKCISRASQILVFLQLMFFFFAFLFFFFFFFFSFCFCISFNSNKIRTCGVPAIGKLVSMVSKDIACDL